MQLRTRPTAHEARHARPALRLGARRPAMLVLCVGLLGASAGSAVAAPSQGAAADLTDGIARIVGQAPAQASTVTTAAPIRPAAAYATASSAAALQAKSVLHVKNQQNKAAQAKAEKAAQAKDAKAAVASARGSQQASRSTARVSGSPRAVGRALVAQRGWGAEQFACLDKLWTKESNWQVSANNPSSSAYGIPQSLPGSKMSSHGSDWRTNPATQIAWGLDYIDDRYGSPCSAWAHSRANNWY